MRPCTVVLVALAGCFVDSPRENVEGETYGPVTLVSLRNWDGWPTGHVEDKNAVFLRVFSDAASEFIFRVVDVHGEVMSTDDESCRHVWLGNNNVIATGACGHVLVKPGLLLVAPFADTDSDENGLMHYSVQVAQVGQDFWSSSLQARLAVEVSPCR